ncbi:MAG TPA: heterodisulfide reductase-related iron-sulfur binding cluster, partial [Acidobacteriaceae bacterium]
MPPTTTPPQQLPSSFDAHHPPEKKYLDDCVHCGFCLPACPTYVLWSEEMDSPRGRIYMIKKAAEGQAPLDQRFRLHMDNCLGCMACMTACPSGVQYDKLIEPTRAQIERNLPRSLGESLFRRLLFATFPYPARLRLLALPLLVYQKCGFRSLVRSTGMTRLLPKRLAAMEDLLPDVPARLFERSHSIVRPGTTPRRRVGMLSGCVQQVFFSHVNAATIRVLVAEGCEVIVPREQSCCGALMLHSGMEADAAALAKKMIAVFEAAKVDTIVINSAGCGSTMKEYGHLLRDDPEWAERAAAFSAQCKDISEFLCELPAQA